MNIFIVFSNKVIVQKKFVFTGSIHNSRSINFAKLIHVNHFTKCPKQLIFSKSYGTSVFEVGWPDLPLPYWSGYTFCQITSCQKTYCPNLYTKKLFSKNILPSDRHTVCLHRLLLETISKADLCKYENYHDSLFCIKIILMTLLMIL